MKNLSQENTRSDDLEQSPRIPSPEVLYEAVMKYHQRIVETGSSERPDDEPRSATGADPAHDDEALNPESSRSESYVWGYARCEDAERFTGAYESREEAIEEGRAYYGDEPFWILKGLYPAPTNFLPDPDWILERMAEAAASEADEAAAEFSDVTKEAKMELKALLSAWAEKHVKARFWVGIGSAEPVAGVTKQ